MSNSFYTSIACNYFIKKSIRENLRLSPKKLIGMVYISCGLMLACNDFDILQGEKIRAGIHGPIIDSVFHEFKRFGRKSIENYSVVAKNDHDAWRCKKVFIKNVKNASLRNEYKNTLSVVWRGYRFYSPWGITEKLKEPESPWFICYKQKEKMIDKKVLEKYYGDILDSL